MNAGQPAVLAERRAAMLAVLPVGVILLEADGQVVEMNPAAHRVLGLQHTPRSLHEVARRLTDPFSGAPLAPAELPWQRALAGHSVNDHDVAVVAPTPSAARRLVTISARPFRDPGAAAPGALVLAFDRVQLLLRQPRPTDLPPYLRRVLVALGAGQPTADLARELDLSLATTRLYLRRLYARLGVNSRAQAVLRGTELGLLGASPAPTALGTARLRPSAQPRATCAARR